MFVFRLCTLLRRFLFFTGKGGVGKTSLACAAAIAPRRRRQAGCCWSAPTRRRTSTRCSGSPGRQPDAGAGRAGPSAMNIDPEAAAEAYRAARAGSR